MPKRTDIKKILVIGSGPIVIGQACEFDYSGTQAIQALKEEGFEVVLINSNPATIMTDPELADRVYVEPLTPEFVEQILEREKPDAILPTMGGQTALNLAMALHEQGILEKYGVQLIGAKPDVIDRAESRERFRECMDRIGVESAKSRVVHNLDEAKQLLDDFGLPLILRPSFTLGGEGGGIAQTETEYFQMVERALFLSPVKQVLIEESLLGWKEFEMEVVRDTKDNVIIVCSIENFDPMGVHTGDSITVAPAQTLTDKEFQNLRDQSIKIIRAIGVETGGSNIQFSVNPNNGRIIVIEMNPRVSRSSALASKATGFPIARVAAKLAVGYTLDELKNDITTTTPASFEPSIDYVVTKIPRFDFEKFKPTPPFLTTQMKSVGEVMAIGRTFQESFGKALSGLENDTNWLAPMEALKNLPAPPPDYRTGPRWDLIDRGNPYRLCAMADALRKGATLNDLFEHSKIDPWFLEHFKRFVECESKLKHTWPADRATLLDLKQRGWSDHSIAKFKGIKEADVRALRESHGIHASFQRVDTCAAEFEAKTPYLYSSYQATEDESGAESGKKKILIIGGGPNRIGQGIEFDYCCVHAALELRKQGVQTLMVNCNPETVSTDFNISDKLFFEPLTEESILNIARVEKPDGVIVQFGGQTPLKLARGLEKAGMKILGTSVQSIDWAEDRKKCEEIIRELAPLGLRQPQAAIAYTRDEAIARARELGFPVLVRPSYVLGGRGMRIVHSEASLREYVDEAIRVSDEHPILIDRFLDKATELDVDALSDGENTIIGGVMEHIEEAGIHSGDSACILPVATLPDSITDRIRTYTRELARRFKVIGLMNCQFAVQGDTVYLLEINPRASRTVPFISKAVGKPLARLAIQVMLGKKLKDLGLDHDLDLELNTYQSKLPVFPFHKFPGVDVLLGPEMKSTGEVMGRGRTVAEAYAKGLLGAGVKVPTSGRVFFSVDDRAKAEALPLAKTLTAMGFEIWATEGTAKFFNSYAIEVHRINKVKEGSPHCVEAIQQKKFELVINTTADESAVHDSFSIRRVALEMKIPYVTVLSAARAMLEAIHEQRERKLKVLPLDKPV